MKSPFTGKEMQLMYEKRIWNFRGEPYEYVHTAWLCADSGEKFTTDEMDDTGFLQVSNQYRVKYGIPFTDEIVAVRAKYGVSASRMSLILGIGVNQWRHYEAGEVPSVSNGRMIRSIMNPEVFRDYVRSARNLLGEKEYDRLLSGIDSIISKGSDSEVYDSARVFQCERGLTNGFAPQSLCRLKNVLLYVLEKSGEVFCTKMNKLLFYIDFLAYRRYGMAVTGLSYKALDYGPVPERWDRVYSQFDEIVQEPRRYGDKEGSVLVSTCRADMEQFSSSELEILEEVCSAFSDLTSVCLSDMSHKEEAWLQCRNDHKRISFEYAFQLKAI